MPRDAPRDRSEAASNRSKRYIDAEMSPPIRKPMTLTQKILAHHARGLTRPWVEAGDILQIAVDWTIASELAWNGMDHRQPFGGGSFKPWFRGYASDARTVMWSTTA